MITLINREDALKRCPKFPLYNGMTDDFYYPEIYKQYIFTVHTEFAEEKIQKTSVQIAYLFLSELKYDKVVCLGDSDLPWRNFEVDNIHVKEAVQYLTAHGVTKEFNGCIQIDQTDYPEFFYHVGWLQRINAAFPDINFCNFDQNILGHLCKYGNVHLNTLDHAADELLFNAIKKTTLVALENMKCSTNP